MQSDTNPKLSPFSNAPVPAPIPEPIAPMPAAPAPQPVQPMPQPQPVVKPLSPLSPLPPEPAVVSALPVKKRDKSSIVIIILVILAFILLVTVGVLLYVSSMSSQKPASTADTNTSTNSTDTTSNSDTDTEETETEDTSYKPVIPAGWKTQTDSASGVSFALPIQTSYQPIPLPDYSALQDNPTAEWYFQTLPGQTIPTFGIYKIPGRYDRSDIGCGTGCADEKFVRITYEDTTKTSEELFADFKAAAEEADPALGNPLLDYNVVSKWGFDDVYEMKVAGGPDGGDDRNRYLFSNGKMSFYIDPYPETDSETLQVLNSLDFK